jgi:hypothetical protein
MTMSAVDLFLAATLLAAPAGTPEHVPSEERWPVVRDAIHKTAIEWELMDPREAPYILAARDDFTGDLNLLRKRYADLHDAPRVAESQRLPDRHTISELIKFNRAYRKYLERRLAWEPDRADRIHEAIREIDLLHGQWDAIRDARCDFYYVTVRRAALMRLRDTIGDDAFAAGTMPPYVPEWLFAGER